MTALKVCHYMREYARATETFVVNQIAALSSVSESVLCRDHLPLTPTSTLASARTSVNAYGLSGAHPIYRRLKIAGPGEAAFYRDSLRSLGPDVLHVHYGTDAAYLLRAVGSIEAPMVVSYYGYDVSRFPQRLFGAARLYLMPVFRRAAMHLAMTPQMAGTLIALGAPLDRVKVHHHGIDVGAWETVDRTASVGTRLLIVASLVEKKGHAVLLKAVALLASAGLDVRLRIVGDGPLRRELESTVSALGIAPRAEFIGYLPHGPQLASEYAAADIFVHPSRVDRRGDSEGLPGTILEAMASGLPIVSTEHAGIPYAVEQNRSGLLVPEGDAAALAQAVRRLIESPAERLAMGAAGRNRVVKDFNIVNQAARLTDLYCEALSN